MRNWEGMGGVTPGASGGHSVRPRMLPKLSAGGAFAEIHIGQKRWPSCVRLYHSCLRSSMRWARAHDGKGSCVPKLRIMCPELSGAGCASIRQWVSTTAPIAYVYHASSVSVSIKLSAKGDPAAGSPAPVYGITAVVGGHVGTISWACALRKEIKHAVDSSQHAAGGLRTFMASRSFDEVTRPVPLQTPFPTSHQKAPQNGRDKFLARKALTTGSTHRRHRFIAKGRRCGVSRP
jgi:hypothetical protein